jgi:hypothetical protein
MRLETLERLTILYRPEKTVHMVCTWSLALLGTECATRSDREHSAREIKHAVPAKPDRGLQTAKRDFRPASQLRNTCA